VPAATAFSRAPADIGRAGLSTTRTDRACAESGRRRRRASPSLAGASSGAGSASKIHSLLTPRWCRPAAAAAPVQASSSKNVMGAGRNRLRARGAQHLGHDVGAF
jgi:hypothetical protein